MRPRFVLFFLIAFSFGINTASAQSTLPSGWSHRDIGAVGVAGSASYASGVFTISAAGPQIYGTADGFHFVYQPMASDGTIVARVLSVQGMRSGTNPAVGVMIRETLAPNSRHVSSFYRTNPMVELMWRPATAGATSFVNSTTGIPLPCWVKVARIGSTISSYMSPNGINWTQVGASQTISILATNVYIGIAVSSTDTNNNSLVTATFDNVSVSSVPWNPPMSPWLDQDVGAVGVPGNASYANGVFTVSGAGPQISGTLDGMHFAFQPMNGNGTIVARVLSLQGAYAGYNPVVAVMIRESLSPGSVHVSSAFRVNPLVALLWRALTNGSSSSSNSTSSAPLPYWIKLIRSGNLFSAYMSPDGISWAQVGATLTINMAQNAYVGLAVSSQNSNNNFLATATFDNVSVTSTTAQPPSISNVWPSTGVPGYDVLLSGSGFGTSQGNSTALLNGTPLVINYWSATSINVTIPPGATSGPLAVFLAPSMNGSNPATFKVLLSPMLDQDVGSVGVQGSASYTNGVFTVSAAGPQIYGTADGFHFVYQPLSGNGTIVARVLSVQGMWTGTNPMVGVMIRETLSANSTHTSSEYRIDPIVELLWRTSTGGSTSFTNSGATPLPYWVEVVRSGNTFSSYISPNGATWTQVGSSKTINMAANVYIGLAVSSTDSNNNNHLVTATFDNLSITSTAVQAPVISDINPFSGPVGSSVTISGANFGVQGANTVTLNGTPCTPSIWSPTLIVVTVTSGATTGNFVVHVGAANSNGVPFTVLPAPTITSLSPTSGPVGTPVTISGTNFGLSQGSSTVKFNGIAAPAASSWGPTSIQVPVPTGALTGNVMVTVSGVPSNVAYFSVTSFGPSITNLNPASGPVGTSVTIAGTNFGASQGTSTVTFNGRTAAASTWSATSMVAAVPSGATTGPVLITVNGIASNPATFTVYTVQPGSPTLLVNPGKMNLVVGQTQAVQLLEKNGVPITNPTWSVANPSLATIVLPVNQGDPTLLQASAVGNTTLTGTSPDNRTGTAQVSILTGTSLPIGTVQWEIPSLGGSSAFPGITNIVQSLRIDDTTPDFYVFDHGANGGTGAIRAMTADGQQKWVFTPSVDSFVLEADDQGGFIYQGEYSGGILNDKVIIGRVDENGNQTWAYIPNNYAPLSNIAIHPDGTIYFVQPDYLNTLTSPAAVVALDGGTGQPKFAIPLPTLSSSGVDYSWLSDPNGGSGGDGYPLLAKYCTPGTAVAPSIGSGKLGNLTISSDGTAYLPIGGGTAYHDAMPCDSSPDPLHPGFPHLVKTADGVSSASSYLQVMAIHSDGSYSTRQLDSASSSQSGYISPGLGSVFYSIDLGGATPDGNGGTLLAVNKSGWPSPSAFYHDTGSAVSKLNLSFNPTSEILTGEDGTAYLAGPNPSPSTTGAIVAINTASNTINWTDSLPTGSPQLIAVPAAGGVVFEDHAGHLNVTDPNGLISPLFPASGGADAGPVNTANANYRSLGTWFASLSDGGFGSMLGYITPVANSERPMANGDPQSNSAPPRFDFELVWCAKGACSKLDPKDPDQDVAFVYYQDNPSKDLSTQINLTTQQVNLIQQNAANAFKLAFQAYKVGVNTGRQGTNTAYVVGEFPQSVNGDVPCGDTNPFNGSLSRMYYLVNMETLQWALNLQTAQPTDRMLQELGEAIGNNAAHEIAHQLVNRWSPSGKVVGGMGLHDGSVDTFNGSGCKDPSVFTGVSTDGKTPIHWGSNADTSLTNILGKKN
jgi:hypothetical protein